MELVNLIKTVKIRLTGKSFRPGSTLKKINSEQLTWILNRSIPRSRIHCIMCGFPRSGTHWIRNVIEKSTGEKTYELFKKYNPTDKNILLIKIHARNKIVARTKAFLELPPHNFDGKYIYVYRDPRDSIISLYEMYKKRKVFSDLKPVEFLHNYDPVGHYRWEIDAWVLHHHKNVLLVKFEDLKSDPLISFTKIFEYLSLKAPVDRKSIGKIVGPVDTKKRPRGTAYGWKNAPIEYTKLIDIVSKKLAREIKMLGYDDV